MTHLLCLLLGALVGYAIGERDTAGYMIGRFRRARRLVRVEPQASGEVWEVEGYRGPGGGVPITGRARVLPRREPPIETSNLVAMRGFEPKSES
ncbi:MAG: hypothetical protein ACYC6M_02980 [Terriglobales bacterium]